VSVVDSLIARLAARQHGVVARRQLLDLGVTVAAIEHRLADGRLIRIHTGVYAVGHARLTPNGRRLAAVIALGPAAVLSHRSAAALHGIRSTNRGAHDVTVPGGSRRHRRGITVHASATLTAADIEVIEGIRVTTIARTLLDLAAVIDGLGVRRAYESAERLDLLDLNALDDLISRNPGHRGLKHLLPLLEYDPGPAARTRSELERVFLDLCRGRGWPMPDVNAWLCGYEVDMYWPEAALVVELDGHAFHRTARQTERDHIKSAELEAAAFRVIRLTHSMLTSRRGWVIAAIEARLKPPPAPARL
jgi:hypothetical protein